MNALVTATENFSLLRFAPNNLPRPFAQEIFLLACVVAGTTHRDLKTVEPTLEIGAKFVLRREPENRYDALAIAIYDANEQHIGYVPRKNNEILAHLLDAGKLLAARLTAKEWKTGYSGSDWLRLDIEIFLCDF